MGKWGERHISHCHHCGEEIEHKPSEVRKYCNIQCCNKDKAIKLSADCAICGIKFKKKQSDFRTDKPCCSVSCSGKLKSNRPLSHIRRAEDTILSRNKECPVCDIAFRAHVAFVKYCSNECSKKAAFNQYQRHAASKAPTYRFICRECGSNVKATFGDTRRTYCSSQCARRYLGRIGRAKRDDRIKGLHIEDVDPYKVFSRDGWTCNHCGIDTPKVSRGTYNLDAPELDHIIPLSKGGEHSYNNTQCLCRGCNMKKGNKLSLQDIILYIKNKDLRGPKECL